MSVYPEVRKTSAVGRLCLRDFVAVMHGDMVFSATVDVEPDAEVFRRHGRALDMPARKSTSPWAIPFHLPRYAFRTELP